MDRAVYRTIKNYKEILESMGVRVRRIILYGSYALGSPGEDSDIDLVVISDDFEKLDLWERLTLIGRAAAMLRKPIEALGYTSEKGSFLADEVKTKGMEVV